MALQIVLGGSGSGKTRYMQEKLIKWQGKSIAIVPEQFTMETQRNIVEASGTNGTMNVDIVSFQRLAERIVEGAGVKLLDIIDDTGKCLVLRKIIEDNKDELKVFGKKVNMPGFVQEIKSLISELYQYGIDDKQMENILEKTKDRPLLNAKLKDVSLIQKKFREYLAEKYIVNEELLSRVCAYVPDSSIIKDSVIAFDEYTGFSPVQFDFIRTILKSAKTVYFAFNVRECHKVDYTKENELNIFNLSIKTINRLKKIAGEEGIEVLPDVILTENYRLKGNQDIDFLEKNIFKYGRHEYGNECENVSVHVCENPVSEADYVAFNIAKMVREENYRYKDIAVITADMESYYSHITESFYKYDIPFFMDYKRSVSSNPMIESIRALFEIAYNNFSYESVFRYLKSGMTRLSRDEVDILENYAITYGLKSARRWKKKIVELDAHEEQVTNQEDQEKISAEKSADSENPESVESTENIENTESTKNHKEIEKTLDEKCEIARLKLMDEVEEFYSAMKKRGGIKTETALKALKECILKLDMEQKLDELSGKLKERGELAKAKEFAKTYNLVEKLLERTNVLAGEEIVDAITLSNMLESGFEEIKVGVVPPTVDSVVVGDIERTRINNVKAIFLIGVNDGIIPKSINAGGVLTNSERILLEENGVELAPTSRENIVTQKFYIYMLLTKMKEKLFVSYVRSGGDGSAMRQSYLIKNIVSLYPQLKIKDESKNEELRKNIVNMKTAKAYVAGNIYNFVKGKMSGEEVRNFLDAFVVCKKNGVDTDTMITSAINRMEKTALDKAVAHAMYGDNLVNSVSRLEDYANCAYKHFMDYGLQLVMRKEFEVDAMNVGNIYHRAIELMFNNIRERNIKYDKVDDDLRRALVAEAVTKSAEETGGEAIFDNARNSYMIDRIKRVSDKTAWILIEQIKAGKFVPAFFEKKFSSEYGLDKLRFEYEDGKTMGLKGIIDRIDYCYSGDNIYVKIIDYKSGNKEFKIRDVYEGLQMQLLLYMEAAVELTKKKFPEKNIVPAGVFYYKIEDPVFDDSNIKDLGSEIVLDENYEINKIKTNILDSKKPDGIFIDDDEVLEALDTSITPESGGGKKSLFIKYETKNDGSAKSCSKNVDKISMNSAINYVHKKIEKLGQEILEGNISPVPIVEGDKVKGCEYCPYNEICGFDVKKDNCRVKRINKMDDEDIWNNIRVEGGEADGR